MTTGRLTTHVLDTARGKPAAGVKIALYRVSGNSHRKIAETVTNADGRTDAPMLTGKEFTAGSYELVFYAGDYLRDFNFSLHINTYITPCSARTKGNSYVP